MDRQIHSNYMEIDIKNGHVATQRVFDSTGVPKLDVDNCSIKFGEFRGPEKVATLKTVSAGDTPIP